MERDGKNKKRGKEEIQLSFFVLIVEFSLLKKKRCAQQVFMWCQTMQKFTSQNDFSDESLLRTELRTFRSFAMT